MLLAAWVAMATMLMFSITLLAWEHLPELRFVQFPWRWLLCLNVVWALSVPIAFHRATTRLLVYVALLSMLAFGCLYIQAPWWENAASISEILGHQRTGEGYEDVDEYVPAGADNYEIKPDAPRVTAENQSAIRTTIQEWNPESRVFTAHVDQPEVLMLRLFNYPSWRVTVNGKLVEAQSDPLTGQMMIPIRAGENEVRIKFIRTWDRTVGGLVSLGALLVLLFAMFWKFSVSLCLSG